MVRAMGVIVAGVLVTASAAEERAVLKGGETIVFFGDSITQNGTYVEYIEIALRTRLHDKTFAIINRGISSETLSGTTEPDHDPPRPCALDRFDRDIVPLKPDIVVACFGMNDGNYFPFDQKRFAAFQKGVRTLIARVTKELDATLVLMTPPPYDAYRRKVVDPDAAEYGYKYPAVDYDDVLKTYSEWLLTLAAEDVQIVDVHSAMNAHLREMRREIASYAFSNDGIHPNATGHFLMAEALLNAWGVSPRSERVFLDAEQTSSTDEESFVLETQPLGPGLPIDTAWDAPSVALFQKEGRLDRVELHLKNLPAGGYTVRVNDQSIARCDASVPVSILDVMPHPNSPLVERGGELASVIRQHQRKRYASWREAVDAGISAPEPRALHDEAAQRTIKNLSKPRVYKIVIEPVDN